MRGGSGPRTCDGKVPMLMKALDRKLLRDLAAMKVQLGAIALVMACGVAARARPAASGR